MGTLISQRSFGSSMALRNSTCNSARVSFTLLLAVVGVCIVWLCCGRLHDSSREVTTIVPPLGFHFLTSLYDSVVALTCRESSFRQSLVEQWVQILQKAHVGARCSTLEIGCGTGSLLMVLADSLPTDCTVAGVDIDEKALQIARQKLGGHADISLARANELPFDANAFDHVFVSLVLHHLGDGAKDALIEAARVLGPKGIYILQSGALTKLFWTRYFSSLSACWTDFVQLRPQPMVNSNLFFLKPISRSNDK